MDRLFQSKFIKYLNLINKLNEVIAKFGLLKAINF